MPTLAELQTLYRENCGKRNMPELFNMTGWWVWSEEKVGEIAGCFYFIGGENHSDFVFYSGKFRGFVVRHRKQIIDMMGNPNSIIHHTSIRSIMGIMVVALSAAGMCVLSISIGERAARHDCYVWGFRQTECLYRMEKISSVEIDACREHLMPVSNCIGLSDTRKGVKDALRFLNGKQVERPPSRDYRSFHVHQ